MSTINIDLEEIVFSGDTVKYTLKCNGSETNRSYFCKRGVTDSDFNNGRKYLYPIQNLLYGEISLEKSLEVLQYFSVKEIPNKEKRIGSLDTARICNEVVNYIFEQNPAKVMVGEREISLTKLNNLKSILKEMDL